MDLVFYSSALFLARSNQVFTSAVGQQRIPKEFLVNYVISLPPIEDQRRIATKLQELMQEVERPRTACEKPLETINACHRHS